MSHAVPGESKNDANAATNNAPSPIRHGEYGDASGSPSTELLGNDESEFGNGRENCPMLQSAKGTWKVVVQVERWSSGTIAVE